MLGDIITLLTQEGAIESVMLVRTMQLSKALGLAPPAHQLHHPNAVAVLKWLKSGKCICNCSQTSHPISVLGNPKTDVIL